MTYFESADDILINRARAERELERHCIDLDDPDWIAWADARQWPVPAQSVLAWLGY